MGRPKKNKKAEIKARRKTRKVNERIADLKREAGKGIHQDAHRER